MLKLFKHTYEKKIEIQPIDGIYNVEETTKYSIVYIGNEVKPDVVFLEDIPIKEDYIRYNREGFELLPHIYFADFFGLATLGNDNFKLTLNIKIDKLKLGDIEGIFNFLWKREDRVFDVFFSKSKTTIDNSKKGNYIPKTSKILSIIEYFYTSFKSLYFDFYVNSNYTLKNTLTEVDFSSKNADYSTINYILDNLDEVSVDHLYQNDPNSFRIMSSYGLINKVKTNVSVRSLDTLENSYILGGFKKILLDISKIKKEVNNNYPNRIEGNQYIDFKDLKILPFIKFQNDIEVYEKKIRKLYFKYKSLFKSKALVQKPKFTPVFKQRPHYSKAFKIITNLWGQKYEIGSQFQFINIRKLSELFELYSFHILIEIIQDYFSNRNHQVKLISDRKDKIFNNFSIESDETVLKISYDKTYNGFGRDGDIVRINGAGHMYYQPDFLIELNSNNQKVYLIFDAKYSKLENVKKFYLNDCIKKYIFNTGIKGDPYRKVDVLGLIYPGSIEYKHVDNVGHYPKIGCFGISTTADDTFKSKLHSFLDAYHIS